MADEPTVTVKVTLSPESLEALKRFEKAPEQFPEAIRRGLDKGMALVRGVIQRERLSGTGPFAVSEHRLGEVSGKLRESTINNPSEIIGDRIVGSITASAANRGFPYGLSQEYGATIRGNPFLVFKVGNQWVKTRKAVVLPARAPFRTELKSKRTAKTLSDEISSEIIKTGEALI